MGRRFTDDGQKKRYCKSLRRILGNVGPRKAGPHPAAGPDDHSVS